MTDFSALTDAVARLSANEDALRLSIADHLAAFKSASAASAVDAATVADLAGKIGGVADALAASKAALDAPPAPVAVAP